MSAIPIASAVPSDVTISLDEILAAVKFLERPALFKLMTAVLKETEKKDKGAKAPRKGSMPKGKIPAQLKKNLKWVQYTLADAKENGWDAYEVTDKKGITTEFQASKLLNGTHVFEDTEKPMIQKQAMSLSKMYKESRPEFYATFESWFEEQEESEEDNEEQKEEPKEEPKAKEEPKKAVKAKEEPKAKETKAKETKAKEEPKKEEPKKAKDTKEAKKVKKTEWECPNDGKVYPFFHDGVSYMRNHDNELWTRNADESIGAWVGIFKNGAIDSSVADPYDE